MADFFTTLALALNSIRLREVSGSNPLIPPPPVLPPVTPQGSFSRSFSRSFSGGTNP